MSSSTTGLAYKQGLKDGLPIGLGYLTISVAFGLYAVHGGLPPITAVLISLSNLTSSGQFAGLRVFFAHGAYTELIITVLLINLRYVLMALSLTQKLDKNCSSWQKMLMGYAVTDEIFAVAAQKDTITFPYFMGLAALPVLGWTSGTAIGAIIGQFLPLGLQSAFDILLYAMFIAIVIPPAQKIFSIRVVIIIAASISCLLYYTDHLTGISLGWRIILTTLVASALAATFYPIAEEERR